MILVAGGVIVASLIIQGASLPWLLRRLGLEPEDFRTDENNAWLKAARAALDSLNRYPDSSAGGPPDAATESVRALYEARVRRLQTAVTNDEAAGGADGNTDEMERYQSLRLELLNVERSVVFALRQEGRINAASWRRMERHLDLVHARLRRS